MRILAVAAHPDDVEVLCAGTLARFARDGHELALAHMTIGDKGGLGDPAETVFLGLIEMIHFELDGSQIRQRGHVAFVLAQNFQVTLNIKAARALGLTLAQSLLAQIDEIIE